jgi:competence protein CoiA
MLRATRKSNGEPAIAYSESRSRGPFICSDCNEEVILKTGKVRVNHFAHVNPIACKFATGESEEHRRCKMEIYQALLQQPGVTKVALERSLTTVRPDVSAIINGVPVAIEVQISTLSQETIIHRTKEYERRGIYVLWLAQWTPYLDGARYGPRLWEKWVHAAYFGRVYYWVKGLQVASYRFEPHYKRIRATTWYSEDGKEMSAGGYRRRSKRWRVPVYGETLDLARDFIPKQREWWKGGDLAIPFAKLYVDRQRRHDQGLPPKGSISTKRC